MKRKVLFITGSINQTSQMHQIAQQLVDYDCWFSQFFTDSKPVNWLIKHTSLLNSTIAAGQFRKNSEDYLNKHGLQIDYGAQKNTYDLVVCCTDLHVPARLSITTKTLVVQEGMTDKLTWFSKIVKALGLPPSLTGDTSLSGSNDSCDVYCVASEGYKQQFSKLGTNINKLVVTGMPNYDNAAQFLDNDFPHRNYVMVATTDMCETYRMENRPAFIKEAVKIANGRKLLFKLHPNEKFDRAEAEIRKYAPEGTLVYQHGNTNHMIANCTELITQYSTVVYTGMALGKKVHSYFDVNDLERLAPVQNGGMSAYNIAYVCRKFIEKGEIRHDFKNPYLELEHLLKQLNTAKNA